MPPHATPHPVSSTVALRVADAVAAAKARKSGKSEAMKPSTRCESRSSSLKRYVDTSVGPTWIFVGAVYKAKGKGLPFVADVSIGTQKKY